MWFSLRNSTRSNTSMSNSLNVFSSSKSHKAKCNHLGGVDALFLLPRSTPIRYQKSSGTRQAAETFLWSCEKPMLRKLKKFLTTSRELVSDVETICRHKLVVDIKITSSCTNVILNNLRFKKIVCCYLDKDVVARSWLVTARDLLFR